MHPNLLDAMTHAKLCARYLAEAYALSIPGPYKHSRAVLAEIKLAAGHSQFVKLAASLGYRIEKIEATAEREEAA